MLASLLLLTTLVAVLTVSATQVMHRPENYKDLLPKPTQVHDGLPSHADHRRPGPKAQFAYFTNWLVDDFFHLPLVKLTSLAGASTVPIFVS